MTCNIPSVNCTLRSVRALNDPYGWNDLNMLSTDRYNAGVLDNHQLRGCFRGEFIYVSFRLRSQGKPPKLWGTLLCLRYVLIHVRELKWEFKYPECRHFTLMFCKNSIEMNKELQRTPTLTLHPLPLWFDY